MTCVPYRRRQSTAPKSGAPKSVRSAAAGQSLDIDGIHLHLTRKPIKNQFIQSFLYYVPYVTLAVMTFPAIINATQSPIAGAAALVVGIAAAWFGASLFQVSVSCCAVVLVLELFLVH